MNDAALDNILEKVHAEFESILDKLFTFVNKLDRYSLKNEYIFEDDEKPEIIINEITTLYG